ncbi:acyltransferase family protein [Limosilactobacillus frumenti]|nr:acyltransferase family protein [Limosilactobacillus frumenti]MBA2914639.1 hypothetical protein [Limosilactobacillus frumenti]QFG72946.1 hypothetical protein LF145_06285 [Limosilactobacillus frumenti]
MNHKVTYEGIDCLKVVAAIGIVAIHTHVPLFETIGRLGLPFFSIVTSFFFFKHYLRLNSHDDRKHYLKKFEVRLLWLYGLWQIIYLPLAVKNSYSFFRTNGCHVFSFFKYIFDLLFKLWPSNVNGWFPSWYIIGMIIALPFSLFVYKYVFRKNKYLYGMFCIVLEIYFVLCSELGFLRLIKLELINSDSFPRLIIYIFIGYLLAKNLNTVKGYNLSKVSILMCVLIICYYLENLIVSHLGGCLSNDETILTMPTSLVIVIFSIIYIPRINEVQSESLRRFSTFLYCFQAWSLAVFDYLNSNKFHITSFTTTAVMDFIFVMITACVAFFIYDYVARATHWKFWNYMV